jgi:hypothetical protein
MQFDNEHKKLADKLQITNYPNFDFIKEQLIEINTQNINFTSEPIKMPLDTKKHQYILHMLECKLPFQINSLDVKDKITKCLFYETCKNLG